MVLAVISTGDAITTVLADIFFPTPSIVAFRGFTVSFLMSVAAAVAVLVTKSVALERAAIVATFLVHILLVDRPIIFGVEGRFWSLWAHRTSRFLLTRLLISSRRCWW